LIRQWSFTRERGRPTIVKAGELLSHSHRSTVASMAMGQNDVLWSAAGCRLLGTDIRNSRTFFPPTQKASRMITQVHFHEGSLLLEVFIWLLHKPGLLTSCTRRQTSIIHSDYMTQGPSEALLVTTPHYLVLLTERHPFPPSNEVAG
jgi:hypothetical protein